LRAYQTENGISACSERIDGTNDFGWHSNITIWGEFTIDYTLKKLSK
jgi:hypothetical protein